SQQPDTSGCQRAAGQSSTDNEDSGLAEPISQPSKIGGNKYHILICGKTLNCQEEIINHLQTLGLKEVAGTDIEAALKKLNGLSESKAAIIMVLHHTFDPEKIVPDSSKCINRPNTLTVDCLFFEDTGLLQCMKNKDALDSIQQWLQPQVFTLYTLLVYYQFLTIQNTCTYELMIVLLGMSGSGKSAVGKMILGRKETCEASVSTVTQKITVEIGTVDKGQVYDCIRMCSCKPYAVLLVIPVKQFTEEQKEIESMKKFFEERCWERVMILFTVTDEQEKQSIIQKQKLLYNCGNRFYSLNIAQTGNSAQVSELLKKIEEMIAKDSSALTELEIKTAIAKYKQGRIERNRNYSKIQPPELQHTIWIAKESKVFQFKDLTNDDFAEINVL
ncbi:hypothetical protein IRJ41_025885, partial [Triplophysa rosa]